MIRSFIEDFKESKFTRNIPILTPLIPISLVGTLHFSIFNKNNLIFKKDHIPTLPPQDKIKPSILFDFSKLLVNI